VAEIRMYGPRSREDLVTVFALKTGALKLPDGPLYDPKRWYAQGDTTLEKEYKRGLLNVRRIFGNIMPAIAPADRMDIYSDPDNARALDGWNAGATGLTGYNYLVNNQLGRFLNPFEGGGIQRDINNLGVQ
jgi:hypothetical protein